MAVSCSILPAFQPCRVYINILDKGLSFATADMTLQPTQQLKLLRHFNDFTKSLCQIYVHKQHQRTNTHQLKSLPLTTTAKVYSPIMPKPT